MSINNKLSILRFLPQTIYFNFRYLPFKIAVKLPILLYKPKFISLRGTVKIEPVDGKISFGMIRLGFRRCGIYPNNGLSWENHGGTCIFNGPCGIGNDSYLSFGKGTEVHFGYDFLSNAGLKLVSTRGISFGKSTRLGWGCLVMDTNFHPLYDIEKQKFKKASGRINIGDYNWFGTECKIMHSVETPERCIFGMGTIVTRGCTMKSYCVMGGSPVKVLSENVMRIIGQDQEGDFS